MTVNNDLDVRGGATFGRGFDSTGNSTIFGTLNVGGTLSSPSGIIGNVTGNIVGNLLGNVTGAASLNVLKTGDTMTGTLNINPSSGNALVATGNAVLGGTLNVTGATTLSNLSATGIVHNNNNGLLTTSLIVNADISTAAAITDNKLATISTAGKVANSATTATGNNIVNTIVARDGSGNFSANIITANLIGNVTGNVFGNISGGIIGNVTGNVVGNLLGNVTGNVAGNVVGNVLGNVTGAASLNVLKSGDTMTGTLTLPAGTAAAPSIQFTGSTNTGISATGNTLILAQTAQTNYKLVVVALQQSLALQLLTTHSIQPALQRLLLAALLHHRYNLPVQLIQDFLSPVLTLWESAPMVH